MGHPSLSYFAVGAIASLALLGLIGLIMDVVDLQRLLEAVASALQLST